MTDHTHLRPDELDLLLEGQLGLDRASHIETCEPCRTAAEDLRDLITQLDSLPALAPSRTFADQVMTSVQVSPALAGAHLTTDDLDAWLAGTLASPARAHLLACPECRKLADAERVLVHRLEQLPLFQPAPQFSERVMDRVAIPLHGWRARVFATSRSRAVAAGLAAAVLGSMGASVAWSMAHQDTLAAVGAWATTAAGQWTMAALKGIGTQLLSQPLVLELRSAASPGRIAGLMALSTALYAGGIIAMRRLLALPAQPVARGLP
jgi:hypothetical protein